MITDIGRLLSVYAELVAAADLDDDGLLANEVPELVHEARRLDGPTIATQASVELALDKLRYLRRRLSLTEIDTAVIVDLDEVLDHLAEAIAAASEVQSVVRALKERSAHGSRPK